MLLEHKPNVNALDKDGCTALAIACKEGYYDIALALINSGAYINVQVRPVRMIILFTFFYPTKQKQNNNVALK